MKRLLPLIAACLTACGTQLTVISPPMKSGLLEKCPPVNKIADPLTTGDQYDVARALNQATEYAKTCRIRQETLVDAIQAREQLMQSIKQQLEKK